MAKIAASLIRGYRRRDRDRAPELCLAVLEQLGGDVANSIHESLRLSDWNRLFGHKIDPRSYSSASDFSRDYLAVSLLSKYPVKDYCSEAQRRDAAIEKFKESERACFITNERFRKLSTGALIKGISVEAVIHTASKKIENLLGPFDWDEAEKHFGFGPGATFRVPSRKGDPYYKFRILPEATPSCGLLGLLAICRSPRWYGAVAERVQGPVGLGDIPIVPGNRITTVPKNAKTDRVIAIEPTMNMYVQKGIGGVIRSRLRRIGVTLDDQRPNQVAARQGSLDGSLATIDLASASDTVAMEVVRSLLPPDWTEAIERCRSPYGILPDGTVIRYQKVSSMGNGFTFELESLLFWAIARAVGELAPQSRDRRLWIYGDDIVVPTGLVDLLVEFLQYFGFTTNVEKSFTDGPFRESCGKHYFHGVDVTPFYVREAVDAVPRVFWFHNQLIRWLRRSDPGSYPMIERSWHDLVLNCRSLVPESFRKFLIPFGEQGTPEDFGDVGFIASFDEARPVLRYPNGLYRFTGIGVSARTLQYDDTAYLIRNLYYLNRVPDGAAGRGSLLSDATKSGVVVREVVQLFKKLTAYRWVDPYLVL